MQLPYDDPELGDENDPEYREEMFRTSQAMGCKPEDYMDIQYAADYREWLAKQR